LDLEIHDGADPGESVSKRGKQGAIAEARMSECLDRVVKLLHFAFNKCRRFPVLMKEGVSGAFAFTFYHYPCDERAQ